MILINFNEVKEILFGADWSRQQQVKRQVWIATRKKYSTLSTLHFICNAACQFCIRNTYLITLYFVYIYLYVLNTCTFFARHELRCANVLVYLVFDWKETVGKYFSLFHNIGWI